MKKIAEKKGISRSISLKDFNVKDAFWKEKMELIRKEIIPYQWDILNDRIEGAAPSFCMRNFRIAGKITKKKQEDGNSYKEPEYTYQGFEVLPEDMNHLEDKFYGFLFQDSDFSKWIEAVAYSLMNHPDSELEALADGAIDIVCAAQQENGYLDTYYIINGMDKIFTNLRSHHELYCFGHLTEGAAAYYQATGKDKLLRAAMKFADFIDDYFGAAEGKCKGYPGHEEAELVLVRLYEVTGEERYLNLSRFFLDQRGTKPYYWEIESNNLLSSDEERYHYHQAHRPVREQDEAVGHAVRAMYLYSGMADIVKYTEDEKLWNACRRLWKSTIREKLYITGGVGGTRQGEAFSFPFDLPNDLAYAETCASIGLAFWARRMLEVEADSQYADVMELALYNTILSGMALDGKSFFYVNPLEVLPEACHKDERKMHVKPVRQKWFGCACCPPNLARMLSSIPTYAYTATEDTLYMHLYIGGTITKEINGEEVELEVQSGFPWNGKVTVTAKKAQDNFMKLAMRIPGWCQDWKPGSIEGKSCSTKQGYFYIEGRWTQGDVIELNFSMFPKVIQADDRVRENIGKVAVTKGPIVYCMEEKDNGADLHLNSIRPEADIREGTIKVNNEMFPTLLVKGKRRKQQPDDGILYTEYQPTEYEDVQLTMIPYFIWANRGENEMAVWVDVFENGNK